MVGLIGGIIVGLTSVGSGSLMIVALMVFYPRLSTRQLVGTDLVQAIPLVAAAALGQMLLGDVKLPLTAALLIGAIPGVIFGARMSAVAPSGPLRWALAVVLSAVGSQAARREQRPAADRAVRRPGDRGRHPAGHPPRGRRAGAQRAGSGDRAGLTITV